MVVPLTNLAELRRIRLCFFEAFRCRFGILDGRFRQDHSKGTEASHVPSDAPTLRQKIQIDENGIVPFGRKFRPIVGIARQVGRSSIQVNGRKELLLLLSSFYPFVSITTYRWTSNSSSSIGNKAFGSRYWLLVSIVIIIIIRVARGIVCSQHHSSGVVVGGVCRCRRCCCNGGSNNETPPVGNRNGIGFRRIGNEQNFRWRERARWLRYFCCSQGGGRRRRLLLLLLLLLLLVLLPPGLGCQFCGAIDGIVNLLLQEGLGGAIANVPSAAVRRYIIIIVVPPSFSGFQGQSHPRSLLIQKILYRCRGLKQSVPQHAEDRIKVRE